MRTLLLALLLLLAARPASAQGLLPPERAIPEVVDTYVEQALAEEKIRPAPPADDATLVRRLTLDLVGRVPTPSESRAYVHSTDPDKRARLVDRLMASPGFVRHQVNEFDALLSNGRHSDLREYLTLAFKDHRPWDKIFRELMRADDSDPKTKGSSAYLRQQVQDLDRLTAEVSSVFFGVNVSCAQCHDHPIVPDWKQDHFYGMKSFFARSFEANGRIGERNEGVVTFKTTKGVGKQARMMFLTGKVIDDPSAALPVEEIKKREKAAKEAAARARKEKKKLPPPPAPAFSARAQLVEVALAPGQNDFFSRSIVNRLWYRFHGTGLVAPLDQMHSENAPTHPELLAWLARDTVGHQYDLRRLIRGLVLSRTYARSSRWDGPGAPRPQTYAVARLRALTPMQLATSLRVATAAPTALDDTVKPEERENRLASFEDGARGFASHFEYPRDDFQVGVAEALLFSNGSHVQEDYLSEHGDRLVGYLKTIKDADAIVDALTRSVLGRPARPEEQALLGDYYLRRKARPVEAVRQMTWALLTSPEFRFNH